MIGPRIGPAVGPRVGPAVGVSADATASGSIIIGVTRDAARGVYCPASAAEWTTLRAAAGGFGGNPSSLWLNQDAASPAVDSIGLVNLAWSPVLPTFRSAIPGWSRLGFRTTDGTANQRLFNNTTAPNAGLMSTLALMYVEFSGVAPSAESGIYDATAAGTPRLSWNTTNKLRLTNVGGTQNDLVNTMPAGVRLIWVQSDLTNSLIRVFTEAEIFVGTFGAPSVAGFWFAVAGMNPAVAGNNAWPYAAEFTGAPAELTTAQIRTLSQTLGWSVAW